MRKRNIWLSVLTCIVAGLGFCHAGMAEESCVEDVVCIETAQKGDRVEFFVGNLQDENLVLFFEMEMTNMVATVQFPYSATYPAHTRTYAFTLSPKDRRNAWEYQYEYNWIPESEMTCTDKVVCVTSSWQNKRLEFRVENRQATNLTMTFTAELNNMISSVDFPYTATYPGQQTSLAFVLTVDEGSDTWNYDYDFDWVWGNLDAEYDDNILYELPYQSGSSYEVIQGFNGAFSHFDDYQYAIDWAMPEGTPVCAVRSGIVVGIEESHITGGPSKDSQNSANYVRIQHDDGTMGEYSHLKPAGANVEIGQKVKTGEIIGFSGNTGYSTRPHLHLVVYKAIDGKRRQSFPIIFRTREQTSTRLEEGQTYTAY